MRSVDVQLLRFFGAVSVQLSVGLGFLRVVQSTISATPDDEKRDDCNDSDGHEASDDDGDERRALTASRDALDGAVVTGLVGADDQGPVVGAIILNSAPDDAERGCGSFEGEDDVVRGNVGGQQRLGDVVHASVGAVAQLELGDPAAFVGSRGFEPERDVVVLVVQDLEFRGLVGDWRNADRRPLGFRTFLESMLKNFF
jgi:hypothetical protein